MEPDALAWASEVDPDHRAALLDRALDASAVALGLVGPDGRLVAANRALAGFLGAQAGPMAVLDAPEGAELALEAKEARLPPALRRLPEGGRGRRLRCCRSTAWTTTAPMGTSPSS